MPDDIQRRKTAVTLEIDADLLEEAQELGVDLPGVLESGLAARVKAERLRKAQEEVRDYAASYAALRERVPSLSDEWADR